MIIHGRHPLFRSSPLQSRSHLLTQSFLLHHPLLYASVLVRSFVHPVISLGTSHPVNNPLLLAILPRPLLSTSSYQRNNKTLCHCLTFCASFDYIFPFSSLLAPANFQTTHFPLLTLHRFTAAMTLTFSPLTFSPLLICS